MSVTIRQIKFPTGERTRAFVLAEQEITRPGSNPAAILAGFTNTTWVTLPLNVMPEMLRAAGFTEDQSWEKGKGPELVDIYPADSLKGRELGIQMWEDLVQETYTRSDGTVVARDGKINPDTGEQVTYRGAWVHRHVRLVLGQGTPVIPEGIDEGDFTVVDGNTFVTVTDTTATKPKLVEQSA